MNPRSPVVRALLAAALAAGGCGGAPPAAVEGPAELDPPSIRSLPGYRATTLGDPVFGGQVFFAEAGPVGAATVVLVHGLGDSAGRDWHPILPALSEHHHVVVFDLPGLEVRGRRAAVVATGPTSLLFSVSRVESRRTRAFVHGVQELARNDEL